MLGKMLQEYRGGSRPGGRCRLRAASVCDVCHLWFLTKKRSQLEVLFADPLKTRPDGIFLFPIAVNSSYSPSFTTA